jgi:hypothetical protein
MQVKSYKLRLAMASCRKRFAAEHTPLTDWQKLLSAQNPQRTSEHE